MMNDFSSRIVTQVLLGCQYPQAGDTASASKLIAIESAVIAAENIIRQKGE